MDKRKKILFIVLLVVASIAIVFWPKPLPAMPVNLDMGEGGDNTGTGSGNLADNGTRIDLQLPNLPPAPVFPLKRGSKGNQVINLQEIINFNDSAYNLTGGKYLTKDGVFGPATEARVLKLFGNKSVTEKQYLDALGKYRASIPYQALSHDNFPLMITSYGNRVAELNFALGVYTDKRHPYSKNFTAKTAAALKAKTGFVSTNAALYTQLTNKPANSK
jgi:hypothetical protein